MRRHPKRKHKDTQAARWAALTPQLDAFLTGIEPQAKAKSLAAAPEPIVQLARQLLGETRRLLPGRARKQAVPTLELRSKLLSPKPLSCWAKPAPA